MNKNKLEYEMKSHGVTRERICKELGISRSAFYRKCNGKSEFTLSEVKRIIEYVGIEHPDDIFFEEKVS